MNGRLSAASTLLILATAGMAFSPARAQTAAQAWLKSEPLAGVKPDARLLAVRILGRSETEVAAEKEIAGYRGSSPRGDESPILLGTSAEFRDAYPEFATAEALGPGGFRVRTVRLGGRSTMLIEGGDDAGALYGAFFLLRQRSEGLEIKGLDRIERPAMAIRWVDEWDNADGSIERGYGGRSIFFDHGAVREDLAPVTEYARLLASVGINGCNLNNVNNAGVFLGPAMLAGIARIASAMRAYGVRIGLSVDIASPAKIGGLSTYDPLDPDVKAWWAQEASKIYTLIPDFAGFTVKADSEGQPGPASFGRTPADAANTLAAAVGSHGGIVLYRAFVYNHHLNWQDPKADRARAAYDIFHPLDGQFAPNVVIQTKEGPIDFQVREPVSPLLGGLEQTSQAMEVQITQEYTGQQRHLVYLAPMWKEVLDFDLRVSRHAAPVKRILASRPSRLGGMVGVACVGQNAWLGSPLALANLYSFGRLAWDPELSPGQIAVEWIRQSISNDSSVVRIVSKMLMRSWPAYESYTGPLGLQTLTDITGSHYGPNVEASEGNGWGQWHKADHQGVGFDRSVAAGTGFTGQYQPEVARVYESQSTTPDNLLLFFHHVPYTYRLHDGRTVIQSIYDSHYRGAQEASDFVVDWQSLKGRIDPALYDEVLGRLEYQAGHAIVWRDAVSEYFLKLSGIRDSTGRAGHHPNRLEAEQARLSGYKVIDVHPWEDASQGQAVSCDLEVCSADFTYTGRPGRFNVAIQYFDLHPGIARFRLVHNGDQADSWSADDTLPTPRAHGDNSTRHIARHLHLEPGDTIRIEARPDQSDPAALDYIEILPARGQAED